MTLAWIVGGSLFGGLLSLLVAAAVLVVRPSALERVLPRLVSFSTGALLGAAFLGMIPKAAEALPVRSVAVSVLGGLFAFYILEKLLVWRHCHERDCAVHAATGPLLLIGDAFHNFVDGVVIAAAFLSSPAVGVTTALSTVAHEVPQEVGEFLVYLRSGYTRRRALALNAATSMTSVLGGVLGYAFLSQLRSAIPFLLAFAAAGFVYVALADLIPAQRTKASFVLTFVDLLLAGAGVGVIAVLARGH